MDGIGDRPQAMAKVTMPARTRCQRQYHDVAVCAPPLAEPTPSTCADPVGRSGNVLPDLVPDVWGWPAIRHRRWQDAGSQLSRPTVAAGQDLGCALYEKSSIVGMSCLRQDRARMLLIWARSPPWR